MENYHTGLFCICSTEQPLYEEEFSYCAKFDEVSGVAVLPDCNLKLYKKSESCFVDVDELRQCW